MKIEFPKDFWWGAATSGPQTEGRFKKKHDNVFDYDFDHYSERFWGSIGPDTTSNFYNDFEEDIRLMQKAGLNSIRTSIQWSRLIEDFETGKTDPQAVAFYNRVIDTFLAAGIRPMMNLHHFDLPVELLHKYGGWESKKVAQLFAQFAEQCFRLFGDRVTEWFTHNEPIVVVECGYLLGFHYPDLKDGKKAVQVAYNLQLASSLAIERFRKINKNAQAKIGIILNLTPNYAKDEEIQNLKAAHFADLWQNQLFLDASVKGYFPQELVNILEQDGVLWESTTEELEIIKDNTVDFLGVNYYHPSRVQEPEFSSDSLAQDWLPEKYYASFNKRGVRMNADRGWEIHPQTIYNIAKTIQNDYNNIPWFISENGMGVENEARFEDKEGIIQDNYRIQFMTEHLYYLHQAISEGSACLGYHTWTPIDCWSWRNSYKNRYGLISLDVHKQIKKLKKSAHWYRKVSESSSIDIEETLLQKLKEDEKWH